MPLPTAGTILLAATNNFVINQYVMKMTFDPLAALAPIAKAAEVPLVLFSIRRCRRARLRT